MTSQQALRMRSGVVPEPVYTRGRGVRSGHFHWTRATPLAFLYSHNVPRNRIKLCKKWIIYWTCLCSIKQGVNVERRSYISSQTIYLCGMREVGIIPENGYTFYCRVSSRKYAIGSAARKALFFKQFVSLYIPDHNCFCSTRAVQSHETIRFAIRKSIGSPKKSIHCGSGGKKNHHFWKLISFTTFIIYYFKLNCKLTN